MGFIFYFIGLLCLTVHQARNRVAPNLINVLLIIGTIFGLMFGAALLFEEVDEVNIEKTTNTIWGVRK